MEHIFFLELDANENPRFKKKQIVLAGLYMAIVPALQRVGRAGRVVPTRAMGQVIGPQHGTWTGFPCRAAHGPRPFSPCRAGSRPVGRVYSKLPVLTSQMTDQTTFISHS